MARRVTLKDVAREAGVTAATVSYVINEKPGQTITPETRERVLKAVADLHYIPNAHARTLRSQSVPCVGVVIRKNLAVPRFAQVVYGIQRSLVAHGCNALLLGDVPDPTFGATDYITAYLAGHVDGIIFVGEDNQGPDEKSVEAIRESKIPFVAYDCQRPSDDYSTIDLDYQGGARHLTERILARGPKRLLYVRPSTDTAQERLREEGVRLACERRGFDGLLVGALPVTLENIDVWDTRYSVGNTAEGLTLTNKFLSVVEQHLSQLSANDAVLSSWSGWTHYYRKLATDLGLVTGELANNGENHLAADFYTVLPNYEAGVACVDELFSLIKSGCPTARTLKLTNVIEATLG